jgi:hypothetical protein
LAKSLYPSVILSEERSDESKDPLSFVHIFVGEGSFDSHAQNQRVLAQDDN